jgi:hypothetical protein
MQTNKDLLHYLYNKNSIKIIDNVIFARDAFQIRRFSLELVKESRGKYESLKDFLEEVDPVEHIENVRQNSITQRIDKSQNPAYNTKPATVQAPTAVPVPPQAPRMSVPTRTKVDDMLDRWLIKE